MPSKLSATLNATVDDRFCVYGNTVECQVATQAVFKKRSNQQPATFTYGIF
jgi:hypothetical protein